MRSILILSIILLALFAWIWQLVSPYEIELYVRPNEETRGKIFKILTKKQKEALRGIQWLPDAGIRFIYND